MKPLASAPCLALTALLIALTANPTLTAQPLPTAAIEGKGLTTTLTVGATGETKLKSGSTRYTAVSSTDVTAAVNQSVTLSPAVELGFGLGYSRTNFDLPRGAGAAPLPETLQSLTLELSYSHKFSDTWSGLAAVSPGLHQAGPGCSAHGLGATVFALGIYQVNPTLTVALGAGYDSLATGSNRAMPGAGIDWKPSATWNFSLGFPKTGVTWHTSASLSVSLLAEGTFGTYYVEKDPLPATGRPGLADTHVEYTDTRLGLSVNWKVSPRCFITATCGFVVDRSFDYDARKFKIKSDEGAGYASLGLARFF
jgi:hypothetical protein